MPRLRIHVQIDGLLAVHAVRAVRTALAGVPGVSGADVSMAGAVLDVDSATVPFDEVAFAAALRAALDHAGVTLIGMQVERGGLPLL